MLEKKLLASADRMRKGYYGPSLGPGFWARRSQGKKEGAQTQRAHTDKDTLKTHAALLLHADGHSGAGVATNAVLCSAEDSRCHLGLLDVPKEEDGWKGVYQPRGGSTCKERYQH